jgi:hypothetical protein
MMTGRCTAFSPRLWHAVALLLCCTILALLTGCTGQKSGGAIQPSAAQPEQNTAADQSAATPELVYRSSIFSWPDSLKLSPNEAEAFMKKANCAAGVTTLAEFKEGLPSGVRLEMETDATFPYHFVFSDGSEVIASFGPKTPESQDMEALPPGELPAE